MVNDSDYNRSVNDRRDDQETPDMSHIGNPDVSHEKNDVNINAVIRFVVGLSIATFVVLALMFGLLKVFQQVGERNDAPVSPLARTGEERLPPNPRLQGAKGHAFTPEDLTHDPNIAEELSGEENREKLDFELERPQMEWEVYRDVKLQELQSYGVDARRPGEYRIPVDRAKELLLERGQLGSRPSSMNDSMSAADRARMAEGYDSSPTYQSGAQQFERRGQ